LGEQALALLRSSGQRRFEAIALENLGRVALAQGEHARAQRLFDDALALAREIGLRAIEASTCLDLGRLHTAQGAPAPADAALGEAGRLMQALGDDMGRLDVQMARADLCLRDSTRPTAERASAARAAITELLPRLLQALPAQATTPPPTAGSADTGTAATSTEALLPMSAYLLACRVLEACGDSTAAALRARALAELRTRAARIPDPLVRRDYLQIAEHRTLLADAAAG
jgi:tetratricopeptide (TPR) repeat protein